MSLYLTIFNKTIGVLNEVVLCFYSHFPFDLFSAIADYSKAVELFPNSFEALFNRGAAKQITGDYAGAITDLTKALQLQPEIASIYLSRAMAFEEKNAGAAIADYTKAIELDPTQAQAFVRRGLILLTLKKKAKARRDLERAIQFDRSLIKIYGEFLQETKK